ncbi:MAG TPA: hypothetical protein DCE47_06375 [Planctomycetaceae bacterium]|nr:hypothetical protein [Planctomycetaceae bacterium]HCD00840.1 hypothetical protein [Planctomycetaceae bacterium]
MPTGAIPAMKLMTRHSTIVLSTALVAVLAAADVVAAVRQPAKVTFLRDVAPVLLRRCSGCHGRRVSRGGYRLHVFSELMRAGESGEASVVAGKPGASELFRRLLEKDPEARMPRQDDPLSAAEIEAIRKWIAGGAVFDGKDPDKPLRSQLPPRQHPMSPVAYPVPVPVFALAFSPDGRQLAVSGYHEVTVWNPADGRLIRRLGRRPQRIHSLDWTADGGSLLVGGGTPGEYGELALVDGQSGRVRHLYGTFDDVVLGAAISKDGKRVAAGSAGRETRAWPVDEIKPAWSSRVHSDWVTGVVFSGDGRFVVSASRDQTVKVHDAATGGLFTTYNGHRKQLGKFTGRFAVYAVGFDETAGRVLSVGAGKAIRIWDPVLAKSENGTAADMEGRFFKAGHTRFIAHGFGKTTFGLDAAAGHAWAGGADGLVREFSVKSLKTVRSYEGLADWVYSVAASLKGDLVAAAGYSGEVVVWSRADGRVVARFLSAPGLKPAGR